jgi:hypothetical protein
MGVKIAKALGCHVTAISRSQAKQEFARSCGADNYIASSSTAQLRAASEVLLCTHIYVLYPPLLSCGGGRGEGERERGREGERERGRETELLHELSKASQWYLV